MFVRLIESFLIKAFLLVAIIFTVQTSATKLENIYILDDQTLMLKFIDGHVSYSDDFRPSYHEKGYIQGQSWYDRSEGDDTLKPFGQPLNKGNADMASSYSLLSTDDSDYTNGRVPQSVSRKSKAWGVSLSERLPAMNHWVYLSLPEKLKRSKNYVLSISGTTNTDQTSKGFVFDEFTLVSEAIHVNTMGYNPDAPWKTADVYAWMGSGGARDYSLYVGNAFHLYNTETEVNEYSGTVQLWKTMDVSNLVSWYENIGSTVWRCDFSDFQGSGTYRLVIEGVGSSIPFTMDRNVFFEPYKVATRGYFFQRLGDSTKAGIEPITRPVPDYKTGRTPNFSVVMSTKDAIGVNPDDWCGDSPLPGSPNNADAWGGWRDAADFDRSYKHSIAVFDMLLTYLLAPDAYKDGDLEINESGNNLPDILDEARYEIDFFLRLRDPSGAYGTAIGNPENKSEDMMCQFAAHTLQAWNVASMSAMLSFSFQKAGFTKLSEQYRDSAVVAYNYADARDQGILADGYEHNIHSLTPRILKAMASVFLYNLTGNTSYEDDFYTYASAMINGPASKLQNPYPSGTEYDLTYIILGYLLTPQQVNYSTLQKNMRQSLISWAKAEGVDKVSTRRGSRSTITVQGVWSGENVTHCRPQLIAMAHRFSNSDADKTLFASALYAEAEWHLGRNPLNTALMTGMGDHSIEQMFTTGQYDGYPGVVPGTTPYMSNEVWVEWPYGNTIQFCEPSFENWPLGELWFNSRYDVSNSEYTIHQTMRGPMVLYGYLHAIESAFPEYPVGLSGIQDNARTRTNNHFNLRDSKTLIFPASMIGNNLELSIVSLSGETVRSIEIRGELSEQGSYELGKQTLPSGIYLCVLKDKDSGNSSKFKFVNN